MGCIRWSRGPSRGEDNRPGDILIVVPATVLGTPLVIVVETKDRNSATGRKIISDTLTKAMAERGAMAGVYVSKTKAGPACTCLGIVEMTPRKASAEHEARRFQDQHHASVMPKVRRSASRSKLPAKQASRRAPAKPRATNEVVLGPKPSFQV